MEIVEGLVKTTLEEVEKVLNARTVVGEPITIGETTLIPVISLGFAFGAGGGQGKGEAKRTDEGSASGVGGGAWVKPKAFIIIDHNGTRVEPVTGRMSSAVEKLGETLPRMLEMVLEKTEERKKEG